MKKSELKSIIKEALTEVLPEALREVLTEKTQKNSTILDEKMDLASLYKNNRSSDISYGLDDHAPRKVSNVKAPSNPKGKMDNGEFFASGKGILEWFSKSGGKTIEKPLAPSEEIDEFISKKLLGGK